MADPAYRKPVISRGEWGLLLLLASVQFTNVLDFVIMMPLAPWAKEQFGIDSEQVTQLGSTVQEDLLTEIDPIEMEEIEGTKNDVFRARLNGRRQRTEV